MIRLDETTVISAPIDRCFDLARSVEVHLAGNVHWGESAVAAAGVTSGLVGPSDRVTWRARHFGLWHNLTSEIVAYQRPEYFQDRMVRGPFRSMVHDHYFRPITPSTTEMRDVFAFEAPLLILGRIVEIAVLGRYMHALLSERNAVVKQIAESDGWRTYLEAGNAGQEQ